MFWFINIKHNILHHTHYANAKTKWRSDKILENTSIKADGSYTYHNRMLLFNRKVKSKSDAYAGRGVCGSCRYFLLCRVSCFCFIFVNLEINIAPLFLDRTILIVCYPKKKKESAGFFIMHYICFIVFNILSPWIPRFE